MIKHIIYPNNQVQKKPNQFTIDNFKLLFQCIIKNNVLCIFKTTLDDAICHYQFLYKVSSI